MLTLILTTVAAVIAWGLVDFGFELAGRSRAGRLAVAALAVVSGAFLPYAIVEAARTTFARDED